LPRNLPAHLDKADAMDTFTCTCCRLDHPCAQPRIASFVDHTPQTLCPGCEIHQGNYLARAENHEAQLRFRLEQAQTRAAELSVTHESRERALKAIARMAELHQPGSDGVCGCGHRECATRVVLSDPWLRGHTSADERRDQSA
jgi:hypothetical protein